jgi:uncharacterized protein (TIGR00299 family) protein
LIHIHLDPVGGIAGDMFVAALLDAFPQHRTGMLKAVRKAGVPASVICRVAAHRGHALAGKRFIVDDSRAKRHHASYLEIREMLARRLPATGVLGYAAAVYLELAEAEAKVHGIPYRKVTFHELGGWDSVADVVAAAYLIHTIGLATWSVGPLPLGSGRVKSAHGPLPVPAPATTLLLKGFTTFDDGIPGERVTPTGAAILKTLDCDPLGLGREPRRLIGTGIGFGARKLPGISNVLRALVFDDGKPAIRPWLTGRIAKIEFEVDDQTPEDLAVGLDHLRAMKGVLDVVQWPAFGKKNRMAVHVQVLCGESYRDGVIAECFRETATIGLRVADVERPMLMREMRRLDAPGIKRVRRPGGAVTAKADIDLVSGVKGAAERDAARRAAVRSARRRQS